jgi:deoxyribonuclease V
MRLAFPPNFTLSPTEAVAEQHALRERVVLRPPAGFAARLVAGADVSFDKGGDTAWAAIVVLDAATLDVVAQASAVATLRFPYVPGLLSYRELPALADAWARLAVRPDVVVFDGQGIAHPRRFGIACHGGLLFDVPSIGCAKSILVGRHAELDERQGAAAPLVDRGEVVGMAVRLRARVQPVYVSPGHLMDLETALAVVLAAGRGFREPETTRRAHRLVNEMRRTGRVTSD